MSKLNIHQKLHHYNEYFKDLHINHKRKALEKLISQRGKYSGNRGKLVIEKLEFIKENYPEILI
jgi:hypothetical protein